MSDLDRRAKNHLLFMKSELDKKHRHMKDLRAALCASRETMDSLLRFTSLSHPILAYNLRVMRSNHETIQMRKASARIEKEERELELLKKRNHELADRVKELESMAEKFLTENHRGSFRGLAAENAKLKAQLLLQSDKYIKKRRRNPPQPDV